MENISVENEFAFGLKKLRDRDLYYMNIAKEVAVASKDPSTKVGAVIIDANNRVISTGYNGFIAGCDENLMSNERPIKYNLVIHAEMNAILYAKVSLSGATMYVTHAPCENCLKHAIQSGIKRIVFGDHALMERYDFYQIDAIFRLVNSVHGKFVLENASGLRMNNLFERENLDNPIGGVDYCYKVKE